MKDSYQTSIDKLRREQLKMQYPFKKERLRKLILIAKQQGLTQFKILDFIKSITGLTYSEIKQIVLPENPEQFISGKKEINGMNNVNLF